jgi:N-acetylmuramoyl-L-alanine amidase
LTPTQQSTRLTLDLSAPVTHNVFTLASPERLVIDLKNTLLAKGLKSIPADQAMIKNFRSAPRNNHDLRIVLDLAASVHTKSFLLKPTGKIGYRLVVDLSTTPQTAKTDTVVPVSMNTAKPPPPTTATATTRMPAMGGITTVQPQIVVAIDAGHGGIDSGTVGQGGTLEKEVALAVAKELFALIANEPGIRPVLIRNGDYFLGLRRRVELARESKADLFISIHADAYPTSNRVHGSTVYMLSRSGASNEAAQWLADKENSADLIGGVKLNDKDELLATVLLDLMQAGTLEASARVGSSVLKALKKVGNNHYTAVQQANFMVLRSPEIPSILVETAFLSNPEDEKNLNNSDYRLHTAQAIFEGMREYFTTHPQLNSLLAHRE